MTPQSLSVSLSRFVPGMELVRKASVRARLRSSRSFTCLRVSFFFLMTGMGIPSVPTTAGDDSSALLAAELAAVDEGLLALLPVRLASRLAAREDGLLDLPSSNASSTISTLPWWIKRPASTFQIVGQMEELNSLLCVMHTNAPSQLRIATANPPSASRSKKFVGSSRINLLSSNQMQVTICIVSDQLTPEASPTTQQQGRP